MAANDAGHVVGRCHHTVHLMYVAILAGNVTLDNLHAVHPCVGCRSATAIGEDVQVVVGDVLLVHIGGQEVYHRLCGVVAKQDDTVGMVAILVP